MSAGEGNFGQELEEELGVEDVEPDDAGDTGGSVETSGDDLVNPNPQDRDPDFNPDEDLPDDSGGSSGGAGGGSSGGDSGAGDDELVNPNPQNRDADFNPDEDLPDDAGGGSGTAGDDSSAGGDLVNPDPQNREPDFNPDEDLPDRDAGVPTERRDGQAGAAGGPPDDFGVDDITRQGPDESPGPDQPSTARPGEEDPLDVGSAVARGDREVGDVSEGQRQRAISEAMREAEGRFEPFRTDDPQQGTTVRSLGDNAVLVNLRERASGQVVTVPVVFGGPGGEAVAPFQPDEAERLVEDRVDEETLQRVRGVRRQQFRERVAQQIQEEFGVEASPQEIGVEREDGQLVADPFATLEARIQAQPRESNLARSQPDLAEQLARDAAARRARTRRQQFREVFGDELDAQEREVLREAGVLSEEEAAAPVESGPALGFNQAPEQFVDGAQGRLAADGQSIADEVDYSGTRFQANVQEESGDTLQDFGELLYGPPASYLAEKRRQAERKVSPVLSLTVSEDDMAAAQRGEEEIFEAAERGNLAAKAYVGGEILQQIGKDVRGGVEQVSPLDRVPYVGGPVERGLLGTTAEAPFLLGSLPAQTAGAAGTAGEAVPNLRKTGEGAVTGTKRTAKFAAENPLEAASMFAAPYAIRGGFRAIRQYRSGTRTADTISYERLTTERGSRGETPVFEAGVREPTARAVSEFRSRARDVPQRLRETIEGDSAVYHTTGERLGSEVRVAEGSSELPGIFVASDVNPVGLRSTSLAGRARSLGQSLRPTLPKTSSDRIAVVEDPSIRGMPQSARGAGYEVRTAQGDAVARGLSRGEAKQLASGAEQLKVAPDATTGGYRYLTEQAEPGRAYVRPRGSRTRELEGVMPPDTRLVETGSAPAMAARVGGREVPVPGTGRSVRVGGERLPIDVYRAEGAARRGTVEGAGAAADGITAGDVPAQYTPLSRAGPSPGTPASSYLAGLSLAGLTGRSRGSATGQPSASDANTTVSDPVSVPSTPGSGPSVVGSTGPSASPAPATDPSVSISDTYRNLFDTTTSGQSQTVSRSGSATDLSVDVSVPGSGRSSSGDSSSPSSSSGTSTPSETGAPTGTDGPSDPSQTDGPSSPTSSTSFPTPFESTPSRPPSTSTPGVPGWPDSPKGPDNGRESDDGRASVFQRQAVGRPDVQPNPIGPGWYNEYVTGVALGPGPRDAPKQSTLRDEPVVFQYLSTLPTASQVSGTDEEQAEIEETTDFLSFEGVNVLGEEDGGD